MNSSCLPPNFADNHAVGREDRALLRSNLSARADARAWAAMLVSLLILPPHAWAVKATNLLEPYIRTSPTQETPWLPFGKIYGAFAHRAAVGGVCTPEACWRIAGG